MLDDFVTVGAAAIGFQEDAFRYLMGYIFEIPIILVLRYIQMDPKVKHLLFGIIGIIVSYFVYSHITLSVFAIMLPTYYIMKTMPNKKGAYISFAISMGILLVWHVKRMIDNYLGYDLDFSAVYMVTTIKYTTFAFSVSNQNDKDYQCSKHTESHKIKEYPTLLEFFGYTYFFPAFFSGPSLEFNDYKAFVEMTLFKDFDNKYPPIPKKEVTVLILTLLSLTGLFFIDGTFSISKGFCEYYMLGHKEESTCWFKILVIFIYVQFAKVKYYFTWTFAELLGVLFGFSYSGMVDGKATWLGFKNVDIWKMETSESIRQIVSNWNIQTEKWLRYYIYERLNQEKALRPYKSLLTNMTSAVWHGFYPGYYISFGTLTLQSKFQYELHVQLLPLLQTKYGNDSLAVKLYHIFNYIYTPFTMLYCFVSFVVLSFSATWTIYSNTYFIPHLFAVSCLLYLKYFPIYKKPKTEESKPKTEESKPKEEENKPKEEENKPKEEEKAEENKPNEEKPKED